LKDLKFKIFKNSLPKKVSFVIIKMEIVLAYKSLYLFAPIAQLVEQLPFKEKVVGSRPTGRTLADLAQLVEQLFCKQQVVGSNPTVGSKKP
jgi:hypothetical protein